MINIDWGNKVINVPQAYLTSLGGGIYQLDINQFRLDLKDLEDGEEGMHFPNTHQHSTAVTVAGTTIARVVEIINGYTVTFEYLGIPYAVNLVGANSNISDVTNVNPVSVRAFNTAGLVVSGSGVLPGDITAIAQATLDELLAGHTIPGSLGEKVQKLLTIAQFLGLK